VGARPTSAAASPQRAVRAACGARLRRWAAQVRRLRIWSTTASAYSTSTCSAARTVGRASPRSPRPSSSDRLSKRSLPHWGWIESRRPWVGWVRQGKTSPSAAPAVADTTPQAATPYRSWDRVAFRVSRVPPDSGSTLRAWRSSAPCQHPGRCHLRSHVRGESLDHRLPLECGEDVEPAESWLS
jgi:hypothetical protein